MWNGSCARRDLHLTRSPAASSASPKTWARSTSTGCWQQQRARAPKPVRKRKRRRRLQEIRSRPFKVTKGEVMTTDRDQSIERLLRQARPAPAADGDCPDADTLA